MKKSTKQTQRRERGLWRRGTAPGCATSGNGLFRVIIIYAALPSQPHGIRRLERGAPITITATSRRRAVSVGTDALGRSVLSRLFLGAHVSMTVVSCPTSSHWPLASCWRSGRVFRPQDRRFCRVAVHHARSIPGIILLIALSSPLPTKCFPGSFFELDLSGMAGVYVLWGSPAGWAHAGSCAPKQ